MDNYVKLNVNKYLTYISHNDKQFLNKATSDDRVFSAKEEENAK